MRVSAMSEPTEEAVLEELAGERHEQRNQRGSS